MITGLQKQSKEPYNKQLINLKYFILIYGKISNLTLVVFTSLSLGQYDYRSRFEIFPLRPLFRLISGNECSLLTTPINLLLIITDLFALKTATHNFAAKKSFVAILWGRIGGRKALYAGYWPSMRSRWLDIY